MRISKVYTRGGDAGKTSLASGARISKASLRVSAYGDVDELNSFLGLARARIKDQALQQLLGQIQNDLFIIGADLATPVPDPAPDPAPNAAKTKSRSMRRVGQSEVESLEKSIDLYNDPLPPLKEFILPAGNEVGALLHVARAVARRAERGAVRLSEDAAEAGKINPQTIAYLNRLSDLLFVLARVVNRQGGSAEVFAEFR
ncbi:MAG: cob(I)yrinic acid a,c-diamide adenosyltransferase [Acidobacteria bacterium]|nr:cob(I)yrinic acid a,c-diamide adenosyltransferase [Acidobacteriota bacterium]